MICFILFFCFRKKLCDQSVIVNMYSTRASGLRIDRDLKCKNGCGFYGNAQCDMLCSKCHHEKILKERQMKGILISIASM